MQIDLVPELLRSCSYEKFVTAMHLFSSILNAYPTSNQDAKALSEVLINIKTKHTHLPTALISDKGSAFVSQIIEEKAAVVGITLKHATKKHSQAIGQLEQSHASVKQALKTETGERRSFCQKYVGIAVLNSDTSYHTSIGCEPRRAFYGRKPCNILDLQLGIRPQQAPIPTSQTLQNVLDQTQVIYRDVRRKAM